LEHNSRRMRGPEPDLSSHVNVLEQIAQAIRRILLAHIRQRGLAATLRATVIDVPFLLKLGCHGAAIVDAAQQTSKRKLVLAVFRLVAASKCLLHALEQL